ncbi:ABC transporter substrate-binding protein [Nocardioides fonticola]
MSHLRTRTLRLTRSALIPAVAVLAIATACAPEADTASDAGASPTASTGEDDGTASADPAACAASADLKKPGVLTIGTDSPAYEPWFVDDDPTNGKGYESAVAYAVADKLGFSADQVEWTTVRFNTSYAPGAKKFDFDINQISITPQRAEKVDFSSGYYSAAQAVIALKDGPAASVTTVDGLKGLKLGAQTGTTSLTAIRDVIAPDQDPAVFQDTNAAKQALLNGQVDAILADLPTAFYITAVEIPKASIIGQFQPETGQQEEFGLLLQKNSTLTPCVDAALAELTSDGTLAELQQKWLSDVVSVPVLQ